MKKNFVYILLSMIIAASLCACGDTTMNNEPMVTTTPNATNRPLPTVSPKMDDGIVDDRDGIIEDDAREGGSVQNTPMIDLDKTEGAEVNTQSTNSPKPTSTTKP